MQGSYSAPLLRKVVGLTIALSPLLVLLLALSPAMAAPASGTTITNCSNDNDLQTAALAGGLITFNCGGTHAPATILLGSVLAPISGTTVDGSNGGHTVVLDGQGSTRVAQIATGRAVTLTHVVLTDGAAVSGSCVDVLGQVELDSVEIHHCVAGASNFGGGLYVEADATAQLDYANLHDNSAGVSGGGIYNSSPSSGATTLYVNNSTLAHNAAGTDNGAVGDGGGLWNAGNATLNSSTIFSNTTAVGYGGGLYNQGSLQVNFGTIAQNVAAQWGGGVRNWTGTANLVTVTLSGNQGDNGGGVASDGAGSTLGIGSAIFQGNQAAFNGGALYLDSSLPAVVDSSTFEGNSAGDGGAIYNGSGQALIQRDTLAGNTAIYGGGVENHGIATLANDTLSSNTAGQIGGGVYSGLNSQTLLWNDTLAGNSAIFSGGALFLESSAVVTATNTIFAGSLHGGNCAGAGGATLAASNSSLSDDVTCTLSGLVHWQDPNGQALHLSGLGNYGGPTLVQMPEHDSPAIDGVVGANAPAVDQRGQSRPANGGHGNGYDIGAVERQPTDTDWAPWLWLPLLRR